MFRFQFEHSFLKIRISSSRACFAVHLLDLFHQAANNSQNIRFARKIRVCTFKTFKFETKIETSDFSSSLY